MPRKPLKPCKHPQCPNLTERYYCVEHKDEMEYKQEQSKHKKLYSSSRWQSLRRYRV